MLKKIFTWWNGVTLGALFDISRHAKKVGEDDFGNSYFEEGKATVDGRKRRYVMYKGYSDASRVPADWHGWLHHTFDEPPTKEPFKIKEWEKPHVPNMTGTLFAYHPKGSIAKITSETPEAENPGYEAWKP